MDAAAAARELMRLFPEVYVRFHRRVGPRAGLTGAMWAVLSHLAGTGPLTVGEMAQHLERAQSVVSEMVDRLEKRGLLARMKDPRDRRRTLVWLTDEAQDAMREDREVLARGLVARAMEDLDPARRAGLVEGMRALVEAGDALARRGARPRRKR